MSQGKDKINISKEEEEKLAKAFKNPEFMKLFNDYVKEISDPAVKKERDEELKKLEKQNRVGGGTVPMFIPTPGSVVRSMEAGGKKRKIIFNIMHSDNVGDAELKEGVDPATKRKGKYYEIPFSLDGIREAKDHRETSSGKDDCLVCDFVFGTNTYNESMLNERLSQVMLQTIVENVESNKSIKIRRQFKHLKSQSYFGDFEKVFGSRKNLVAAQQQSASNAAQALADADNAAAEPTKAPAVKSSPAGASQPGDLDRLAKLFEEATAQQLQRDMASGGVAVPSKPSDVPAAPKAKQQPAAKAASARRRKPQRGAGRAKAKEVALPSQLQQQAAAAAPVVIPGISETEPAGARKPLIEDVTPSQVMVPSYTIVHSGNFDVQDYVNDTAEAKPAQRPRRLVVRIALPRLDNPGAIDLDVEERRLILEVKDLYKLDIPLSFPVLADETGANYIKKENVLAVTLPVRPLPVAAAALRVSDHMAPPPDTVPAASLVEEVKAEEEVKEQEAVAEKPAEKPKLKEAPVETETKSKASSGVKTPPAPLEQMEIEEMDEEEVEEEIDTKEKADDLTEAERLALGSEFLGGDLTFGEAGDSKVEKEEGTFAAPNGGATYVPEKAASMIFQFES